MVAATETLAAGINMPARTTVIGSLSRRQNVGHVLLKHNQLLQMAGRAGRRGFDIAGAAVPCPSPCHLQKLQALHTLQPCFICCPGFCMY